MSSLSLTRTEIPGLLVLDLPVHGDSRGWFKENWQREKMVALGLPDFRPVQNNVALNSSRGTTRGIHAEPWDKLISVASGRIFGAWVDLREGPGFGTTVTLEVDPSRAVFVPRGVGNAYQTLEPDTVYSYLVNDHWSPDARYTLLNLADETVAVPWPIDLSEAEVSQKDREHPRLGEITPVAPRRTLVLGADGQLGRALRSEYADDPSVEFASRSDLDLTAGDLEGARRWSDYGTVINAAAFTAVDRAETPEGRREAWRSNVHGVAALSRVATEHDLVLVHVSSDYVFDGSAERPYREDDPICPLGVYGQSKAAADEIVSTVPRHLILRTSWVIGDGSNFVRTMAALAEKGVDPQVVDDQRGRLTSTADIARAIRHLLGLADAHGTYHLTGGGESASWAEIAREVFALGGHDPQRVRPVSTEEYARTRTEPMAPRPANSVLDLARIEATGFVPQDWRDVLSIGIGSSAAV